MSGGALAAGGFIYPTAWGNQAAPPNTVGTFGEVGVATTERFAPPAAHAAFPKMGVESGGIDASVATPMTAGPMAPMVQPPAVTEISPADTSNFYARQDKLFHGRPRERQMVVVHPKGSAGHVESIKEHFKGLKFDYTHAGVTYTVGLMFARRDSKELGVTGQVYYDDLSTDPDANRAIVQRALTHQFASVKTDDGFNNRIFAELDEIIRKNPDYSDVHLFTSGNVIPQYLGVEGASVDQRRKAGIKIVGLEEVRQMQHTHYAAKDSDVEQKYAFIIGATPQDRIHRLYNYEAQGELAHYETMFGAIDPDSEDHFYPSTSHAHVNMKMESPMMAFLIAMWPELRRTTPDTSPDWGPPLDDAALSQWVDMRDSQANFCDGKLTDLFSLITSKAPGDSTMAFTIQPRSDDSHHFVVPKEFYAQLKEAVRKNAVASTISLDDFNILVNDLGGAGVGGASIKASFTLLAVSFGPGCFAFKMRNRSY